MDSIFAAAVDAAQEDEACLRAMQLTSFSVLPMTLKVAIDLGVFEVIAGADAQLSAAEIVARIPATISNPQAPIVLDRTLCLLVSYSVLACSISLTGERCYGSEPVIKYLTPGIDGVSLAWLGLAHQDKMMLESWHHLKDIVVGGGIPFNKAYGVEHVGRDMFSSIPSGDAIFMKHILHDWRDEHCSKLLKNYWKALLENEKVIVVDYILPVKPEPTLAAQNVFLIDLIMLANTPGGKERSEREFESLVKLAGFSEFKAIYIFSGCWLMEFTKQTK